MDYCLVNIFMRCTVIITLKYHKKNMKKCYYSAILLRIVNEICYFIYLEF